jgi:hypothetical protein
MPESAGSRRIAARETAGQVAETLQDQRIRATGTFAVTPASGGHTAG